MGFYSPATLIEDAKRHHVEVLPICVQRSQWECTLEKSSNGFAVRMGLCYVRSLSPKEAQKIIEIQSTAHTMNTFIAQAQLNEQALRHLNDRSFRIFSLNQKIDVVGDKTARNSFLSIIPAGLGFLRRISKVQWIEKACSGHIEDLQQLFPVSSS